MQIFQNYYWPGNVRELSNIIERILYTLDGDTIRLRHLPIFLQSIGRRLTQISIDPSETSPRGYGKRGFNSHDPPCKR